MQATWNPSTEWVKTLTCGPGAHGDDTMANVLVTGSNKGLGLELCRQLAGKGDRVIAACRRSSPELHALDVEVIEGVDVADDASVRSFVERLDGRTIDLLVNNAGMMSVQSLSNLDFPEILQQFEVNTLGPLRVTHGLLSCLQRGSKVAIVTSLMGSVTDNTSGGSYGYRISKAGVNMAGRSLAHDLRGRGIAVVLLHPGLVATEMTGGRGISTSESVRGLLERIDSLTLDDSGSFWHADGRRLPW